MARRTPAPPLTRSPSFVPALRAVSGSSPCIVHFATITCSVSYVRVHAAALRRRGSDGCGRLGVMAGTGCVLGN